MPQTIAERLDRLEAENAALRARLAAVEGPTEAPPVPPAAPKPAPYIESRPVMRTVLPSTGSMPTDDELRELRRIVGLTYPDLVPAPRFGSSDHELFRDFANAFRAVGKLGRTATLDATRAVSWWIDYAESLVDRGAGQTGFGSQFMAAVLAWGDIPYRAWSPSSPGEFGLTWAHAGTPAADAWRGTLARGKVAPPSAPARDPVDYRTGRLAVGADR